MRAPFALLKCLGKALVKHVGNAVGLGVAGDVLLDVGEAAWQDWNREQDEAKKRAELQAIAQAAADECRKQVEEVVREVAAGQPREVRRLVEGYLEQVPGLLRHTVPRLANPAAASLPPDRELRSSADLLSFLSVPPSFPARAEESRCLAGHAGPVQAVAFSPDGSRLLSAGQDGTLRLWDVAAAPPLLGLEGHRGPVRAAAFSPDGRTGLSGSEDRTVRLWDIVTGQERHCFAGHGSAVWSVAFSPDGRQALSAGGGFEGQEEPADTSILLWDLEAGRELRRFEGPGCPVCSVVFAGDGRHVLSGEWNHRLRYWDLVTGQDLRIIRGHEGPVWSVALSPTGRHALSGSTDATARLWEVASGRELRRLEGHQDWVTSVAFSPDARFALSGSEDGTVRLWDVLGGRPLYSYKGHTAGVQGVAVSPDGRQLASGSKDGTVRLWWLPQGKGTADERG